MAQNKDGNMLVRPPFRKGRLKIQHATRMSAGSSVHGGSSLRSTATADAATTTSENVSRAISELPVASAAVAVGKKPSEKPYARRWAPSATKLLIEWFLGLRRCVWRPMPPHSMTAEPPAELRHIIQAIGTKGDRALPTSISAAAMRTATTTLRAARCFSSEANVRPHKIIEAPSVKRSSASTKSASQNGSERCIASITRTSAAAKIMTAEMGTRGLRTPQRLQMRNVTKTQSVMKRSSMMGELSPTDVE